MPSQHTSTPYFQANNLRSGFAAKTTTLSAARAAFLYDARVRSEVILSNADSLTVLLMQLGRKRMSPDFSFNESVTSLL